MKRTRAEEQAYRAAYDKAVRDFPKGGGLLGGTARLLAAQYAGDEAVRQLRASRRQAE